MRRNRKPAGALEERVLVVLARDGLNRRQVHDHAEPGEPPQERDHDRPQRHAGIRERSDGQRVDPERAAQASPRSRRTARTGTSRPSRRPPGQARRARRTPRTLLNTVRPRRTPATSTASSWPNPVWSTTATPVNSTVFSRPSDGTPRRRRSPVRSGRDPRSSLRSNPVRVVHAQDEPVEQRIQEERGVRIAPAWGRGTGGRSRLRDAGGRARGGRRVPTPGHVQPAAIRLGRASPGVRRSLEHCNQVAGSDLSNHT